MSPSASRMKAKLNVHNAARDMDIKLINSSFRGLSPV